MQPGTTSVLTFSSRARRPMRASALVRVGLAAAIAGAPVSAALAQTPSQTGVNQPRQIEGQRQPTPGRLLVPVTGTLGTPATSEPQAPGAAVTQAPAVTGLFSIQRFARTTENAVAAVGTLTVSFTDPETSAARTIVTQIAMPLQRSTGVRPPGDTPQPGATAGVTQACESLSLVLGPLDVTLLGNAVHLDAVTVDLTVVPGTGQRLATLICDVAGQLGAATPPADLLKTLNALLDTVA
jgi:hypothetical protein